MEKLGNDVMAPLLLNFEIITQLFLMVFFVEFEQVNTTFYKMTNKSSKLYIKTMD